MQKTEQRPAQDDRDAFFERVVGQHARTLYRVAYSLLRDAADAEDAVGDAMVKLIRTGAWRGVEQERPFLARVVWRTALDRLQARPPVADELHPEAMLASGEPSPEWLAVDGDRRRLLGALIDGLPEELREPLVLSAVEELSSREIGAVMHLPEGTVRTRLMRARAVLREQVRELERNGQDREAAAQGHKS